MRIARRSLQVLGALFLLATLSSPAAASAEDIVRFELENGLQVVLRPVKGAALMATCVVFDLGEDHDPANKSGLAHVVEHCYVTCAAGDIPLRTAQEMMDAHPHGWNAQTGARYTVIAFVFPPENLEAELRDASARMGDLHVRERDLEREKPRVLQELHNMFDGYPPLAAMNRAYEMAHPSPAGARRGGVPEQVASLTVEDVSAHWKRFYKPKNATLVVAGDFDPAEVRPRIVGLFRGIPSGEEAPAPRARPAPDLGRVETAALNGGASGQAGRACIAYRTPAFDDPAYAPFLLFTGRLLAAQIRSGNDPGAPKAVYAVLDNPHVMLVSTAVSTDESPEAAIGRIRAWVNGLAEAPLTPADVGGARFHFMSTLETLPMPDAIRAGNLYGAAFGLVRREQLGIDSKALIEALRTATEEDFRAMVKSVLSEEKSAGVVVVPKR